jgi:hypothetical protein
MVRGSAGSAGSERMGRGAAAAARLVVVVAAASALAAAPAAAQYRTASTTQRPIEFLIGGGVTVPVSDARDAFKNGVNGTAAIVFHSAALPIALRAGFTFQRFDMKDIQFAGVTQDVSGNGKLMGGLLNASFEVPVGFIRPYVTAGAGIYNLKVTADNVPTFPGGDVIGSTSQSESDTKWGINGGAGLKIGLGRVNAFVEGRVDNVYTDKGMIDTKSIKTVPVTVGISF